RSLNLSTAQDGCLLISGVLDPVAGAAVRGALEPLARPSGEHDDRRREQRLADALYERVTGNTPVSLQVTATVETLRALAGAAGGRPPGATAITWCTGWTAGRPTSRTRSCSASATTAWSTRVGGS